MDLRPSRSTRYLPIVLMLVIGLALVGLVMLAVPATQASSVYIPPVPPTITPVAGINYEVGNFCVDDYQAGSVCTANDVELASLTPDITEVCLTPGDTATVQFKAELKLNATSRYDIGLFIATDGGSAQTGNACYHDFLQPVTTGTPNLAGGYGPFRQLDASPDICGDLSSGDANAFYFTQIPVTVTCVDNNNDGVVDPISTCLSWDNNAGGTCTTVKHAFPSTNSKCRCAPVSPSTPILLYAGYDFGDLPDTGAGTSTGNYQTIKTDGGPYHAIQKDITADGNPDTAGGVPAVWLGPTVDNEIDGQPTGDAKGDDANDTNPVLPTNQDDEDGITPIVGWTAGGTGTVQVVVSSSNNTCTGCNLAYYFDWNNDGDFLDGNESGSAPVGFGTNNVQFNTPGTLPTSVYARFRLYTATASLGGYASTGLVLNGEVEDYQFDLVPLGVTLVDFSAVCAAGQPEIHWETNSELTTLGFNVWRNTSNSDPQDKLNDTMIPAHPGSAQGYTYSFTDTTAQANTTYYYWLEDIDTGNVSTFHGPIEAQCQSPTSVGLDTVEASPVAGLPVAALPAAGLLALGAVGATAAWLRRRRA